MDVSSKLQNFFPPITPAQVLFCSARDTCVVNCDVLCYDSDRKKAVCRKCETEYCPKPHIGHDKNNVRQKDEQCGYAHPEKRDTHTPKFHNALYTPFLWYQLSIPRILLKKSIVASVAIVIASRAVIKEAADPRLVIEEGHRVARGFLGQEAAPRRLVDRAPLFDL